MGEPLVPIAPASITQKTCEAACGLLPRRFLRLVSELDIPHTRNGKLVIVRWSALEQALIANEVRRVEPTAVDEQIAQLRAERRARRAGRPATPARRKRP